MSRSSVTVSLRLPRTCGDEPYSGDKRATREEFAPHLRG